MVNNQPGQPGIAIFIFSSKPTEKDTYARLAGPNPKWIKSRTSVPTVLFRNRACLPEFEGSLRMRKAKLQGYIPTPANTTSNTCLHLPLAGAIGNEKWNEPCWEPLRRNNHQLVVSLGINHFSFPSLAHRSRQRALLGPPDLRGRISWYFFWTSILVGFGTLPTKKGLKKGTQLDLDSFPPKTENRKRRDLGRSSESSRGCPPPPGPAARPPSLRGRSAREEAPRALTAGGVSGIRGESNHFGSGPHPNNELYTIVDEIHFASPDKAQNDDSPAKQTMVSTMVLTWCRISAIHSMGGGWLWRAWVGSICQGPCKTKTQLPGLEMKGDPKY